MSFDVVAAGELEFPSEKHRERWHASKVNPSVFPDLAAHFDSAGARSTPGGSAKSIERSRPTAIAEVLASYRDAASADRSLTYFLELAPADAVLAIRGLVHGERFRAEFLALFAAAAAFGAKGTLRFETTEGDAYALACDGTEATFATVEIGALTPQLTQQILAEAERRSGKRATPAAAKPVLAAIAALGNPPDERAVQQILEAAMQLGDVDRRAVLAALAARRIAKSREARKTAKKAKRTDARTKPRR